MPPDHPRHTTRVWDAILATELPLDEPLLVAPVYWQQYILHWGANPSVSSLYIEAHTLIWTGLEDATAAHGAVGWAGTLQVFLAMLPQIFITSNSRHTLPGPWVETMPHLCSTQLRTDWKATPGGQSRTTLVHQPTPNWLFANLVAYIHCLLEVLAPLDRQL